MRGSGKTRPVTPAAVRCCGGHRLLPGFIRPSPPPPASALLHCAGTRGPSRTRRSRLGARRARQHRALRRRAAARRSRSWCSPVAALPAASHEARPSPQLRTGVPSAAPPPPAAPTSPRRSSAATRAHPRPAPLTGRSRRTLSSRPPCRTAGPPLPSPPFLSPPLPAPQAHRAAQRCGFTAHGRRSASRARTPRHG